MIKKGDSPIPINSKYPSFEVGRGVRLGDRGDFMPEGGDFMPESFALLSAERRVGDDGQLN